MEEQPERIVVSRRTEVPRITVMRALTLEITANPPAVTPSYQAVSERYSSAARRLAPGLRGFSVAWVVQSEDWARLRSRK